MHAVNISGSLTVVVMLLPVLRESELMHTMGVSLANRVQARAGLP